MRCRTRIYAQPDHVLHDSHGRSLCKRSSACPASITLTDGNGTCGVLVSTPCQATNVETILLVDDDARTLAPLQVLLESEGYRVLLAPDGETAASVTDLEHPDLIVTDWMMPVLDGIAFCRRLKTSNATANIPVVMLTAAVPPTQAAPLWNVLLRKPTRVADLIHVIRDLLAIAGNRGPY